MDSSQPLADSSFSPLHVAIIMDGNGRWAKARGLPRSAGHKRGAEAVRETVKAAVELGITHLTLFGFSSENWNRPETEVRDLMGLMRLYLRTEVDTLHRNGIRLKVIGDRAKLGSDLAALIGAGEKKTADNDRLVLTVALSYGGRQELTAASRRLAEDVLAGRLAPDAIDEKALAARLFTADLPDPDLLIRTSGEMRVSNFLLWQLAYAEMVFLDVLWPDFTKQDLAFAIQDFQRRERRYGSLA